MPMQFFRNVKRVTYYVQLTTPNALLSKRKRITYYLQPITYNLVPHRLTGLQHGLYSFQGFSFTAQA
jgi:hypothetical protein